MLKPQLHVGKLHPLEKIHHPIKNYVQCKAIGGVYTSTFLGAKHGSAWLQWCLCNEFNLPTNNIWKGWVIDIKEDAKIYIVDSLDDMHFLYDTYSYEMFEGSNMEQINFEKMQEDYDGIHITEQGQNVTRHGSLFQNIPMDKKRGMRNMYGWDVESTQFFRNVFAEMKEIEIEPVVNNWWE